MTDIFIFFKQKTTYELRISDWSSDVCSSDLLGGEAAVGMRRVERTQLDAGQGFPRQDLAHHFALHGLGDDAVAAARVVLRRRDDDDVAVAIDRQHAVAEIGRAQV